MKSHPLTQKYTNRPDAIFSDCRVSPYSVQQFKAHSEQRIYKALWDTGANHSVISKKVVAELNLPVVAYNENHSAGGILIVTNHLINIILPNNIEISSLLVSCCDLDDVDILIGMDVITMCDFAITNENEQTTFSFQIPSATTIDFEKIIQKNNV